MITASSSLQDLRRRLYGTAKADSRRDEVEYGADRRSEPESAPRRQVP